MEGNAPLNGGAEAAPQGASPAKKAVTLVVTVAVLALFGLVLLLEPELKYADPKDCSLHIRCHLPKLFGGVLLVNVVVSTLIMVFVLSFGYAGSARAKYGFPLPTMYASTDIYSLDVESQGQLLGGGEAAARERLQKATLYNCHQRAHQQPLETYASFLMLSLLGGLQYPALTTFYGVMWCISRVVWARGYATGEPGDRYRNKIFGSWVWCEYCSSSSATFSERWLEKPCLRCPS